MLAVATSVVATLVVLADCQKTSLQPVAIEANDMCSFCKMAISEKRYSAEFIDNDGQAFKFDDIGCMTNFIKQKRNNSGMSATFVMDYDRGEWIKAQNAFYVRSSDFKTPMSGGIVAFQDRASAQQAVDRYHGKLIQYEEILK